MKLKNIKETLRDDRGFILILALVTMLAMTLIGLSIVMNMTTDMQLARNDREAKLAFQLAEAGIKESIARLHLTKGNAKYIGEKSTDPGYRTTGWAGHSFGVSTATSVDGLNYDVTLAYLTESNQENFCDSNNNLSPNTSLNAVTYPTAYTCDKATPEVVMYGRDFGLTDTVTKISYGKLPVYSIVSTGTSNGTTRQIEAYVGASTLNTDTEAGINTNACVSVAGGAATVNGGVREGGTGCAASTCDDGLGGCVVKTSTDEMTTYLGEDLSAIIDMADERHSCKNWTCSAPGDDIPSSGAIEDVIVDWGLPASDPNTHSSLIYIDNSGGRPVSLSGNFTGRGILIVSGDLTLSGTLAYEGLVYVLGTLTMGGGGGDSLNVFGGVMANDMVTLNGSITATYDRDTLEDVGRQSGSAGIILWKRF